MEPNDQTSPAHRYYMELDRYNQIAKLVDPLMGCDGDPLLATGTRMMWFGVVNHAIVEGAANERGDIITYLHRIGEHDLALLIEEGAHIPMTLTREQRDKLLLLVGDYAYAYEAVYVNEAATALTGILAHALDLMSEAYAAGRRDERADSDQYDKDHGR